MDCSRTWGRGTSFGDAAADWRIMGNLTGTEFPASPFLPHKTTGGEGLFLQCCGKQMDEPAVSVRTKTGGKAGPKRKRRCGGCASSAKEMKAWVQGAETMCLK